MKLVSLIITFLTFLAAVNASEILIEGKVYNPTAGYFSVLRGEFKINYINGDTQFGDKVYLKYGYSGGYSQNGDSNHWDKENKIEMQAVSDYEWSTYFEDEVASRGSYSYNHLDFVIVVTDSRGNEKYIDNGTEGRNWSFYRLDLMIGTDLILREYYVVK